MTECERIRAEAPGVAALPPDHPARAAAREHARACPGCARALAEAERLQGLLGLGALAASTPAPGPALQALLAGLRRERRRRSLGALGAALAVAAALLGFAHHRAGTAGDWVLGAALAVLSAGLAALSPRWPRRALAAGIAVALAAVALAGGPGPLDPAHGLHCLLTELLGAGVVLGAGWLALRGGGTRPARVAVAAGAAAGALAGQATLQLTCDEHGVTAHLLVFHAGGVVLAALLAGAIAALLRRRQLADG